VDLLKAPQVLYWRGLYHPPGAAHLKEHGIKPVQSLAD